MSASDHEVDAAQSDLDGEMGKKSQRSPMLVTSVDERWEKGP